MNQNPKLPKNEHSTIYPLGHSESIKVYESKPDVDIYNAFNSGNEIAFNYIYRIYVTVLFKYGWQMCKDQYHIHDCIQNIFIHLRRKRGQLNEVQSIKAYLFKILYREMIRKSNKSKEAVHQDHEKNANNFSIEFSHETKLIQQENLQEKLESIQIAINKLTTKTLTLEELYIPKSKRQEIFDQVEKDLKEALTLFDRYDASNVGRATSFAAKTVLAELYLWQKKWAEAKVLLESVINSGNFSLLDSYSSLFDRTIENHSETIFEIQYKENTGQPLLGKFSTTHSAPKGEGYVPGGGWGWIRPTQDLVNEYEVEPKEDPRLTSSIFRLGDDFEGQIFQDVVNGTGFAIKKWAISGANWVEIEQNFPWYTSANFTLYRYAEVLLMYAEVLNELGNSSTAATYVNFVKGKTIG